MQAKTLKVPSDISLVQFNTLQLAKCLSPTLIDSVIHCFNCNFRIGKDSTKIMRGLVAETAFDFVRDLKILIHNHGQDNLKQDLIFASLDK